MLMYSLLDSTLLYSHITTDVTIKITIHNIPLRLVDTHHALAKGHGARPNATVEGGQDGSTT